MSVPTHMGSHSKDRCRWYALSGTQDLRREHRSAVIFFAVIALAVALSFTG